MNFGGKQCYKSTGNNIDIYVNNDDEKKNKTWSGATDGGKSCEIETERKWEINRNIGR